MLRQQYADNYTNTLPVFSPTKELASLIGSSVVAKSEILKPESLKKINELLKKALRAFLKNAQVNLTKDSPRKITSP